MERINAEHEIVKKYLSLPREERDQVFVQLIEMSDSESLIYLLSSLGGQAYAQVRR